MGSISRQLELGPNIIDSAARDTPDRTFAVLPKGDTLQDGFMELSCAALAKAVNRTCFWMDETLGNKITSEDRNDWPTVPYIGPNDFRFSLLQYATMKSRRKLMVPLAYNTPEGMVKILQAEKVKTLLVGESHISAWDETRKRMDVELVVVPDLWHFINDEPVKHYEYTRKYEDGRRDDMWVIQTSGTTGDPKPIHMSSQVIEGQLKDLEEYASAPPDQKLAYVDTFHGAWTPNTFPLSWAAGLAVVAIWPLTTGNIPILLPASAPQPMNAEYMLDVIKYAPKGPKNTVMLVPTAIRDIASNPEALKALSAFDIVGYAGAPLDQETGDKVSKYARVQSFIGSTDSGLYPLLLDDPEDWNIHRFHPTYLGLFMEPFQDDLYELCIRRMEDEHRHCFFIGEAAGKDVFHTKDLWKAVPGRPGFYTGAGRVDDFVKLASMTKFNAVAFESIIDKHPDLKGSVVAGDAQKRPFLIIEPKDSLRFSCNSDAEIVDAVWSQVEEGNKNVFEEAKLTKPLTIVTRVDCPIKRTGKNTVSRRAVLMDYEKDVEEMYERARVAGLLEGGVNAAEYVQKNGK